MFRMVPNLNRLNMKSIPAPAATEKRRSPQRAGASRTPPESLFSEQARKPRTKRNGKAVSLEAAARTLHRKIFHPAAPSRQAMTNPRVAKAASISPKLVLAYQRSGPDRSTARKNQASRLELRRSP